VARHTQAPRRPTPSKGKQEEAEGGEMRRQRRSARASMHPMCVCARMRACVPACVRIHGHRYAYNYARIPCACVCVRACVRTHMHASYVARCAAALCRHALSDDRAAVRPAEEVQPPTVAPRIVAPAPDCVLFQETTGKNQIVPSMRHTNSLLIEMRREEQCRRREEKRASTFCG
jgi:hypothetical protein